MDVWVKKKCVNEMSTSQFLWYGQIIFNNGHVQLYDIELEQYYVLCINDLNLAYIAIIFPYQTLTNVTQPQIIVKAIKEAKAGQVEIRNDKDGNIGLSIGKKSFEDTKMINNYNAVIDVLEKEKSNTSIKGDLIKQVYITSTMGVAYKIKLNKDM